MLVATIDGEVDESSLRKCEASAEDDDKRIEVVEYCRAGCDERVHAFERTVFEPCPRHVHRSVHVTAKRWPGVGAAAVAQPLT